MVTAGHMDELSLSDVAIATSLTNVTLCGQAFVAERFGKIWCIHLRLNALSSRFCLPISLEWVFMDKLLEFFHQDPQLACISALFRCSSSTYDCISSSNDWFFLFSRTLLALSVIAFASVASSIN